MTFTVWKKGDSEPVHYEDLGSEIHFTEMKKVVHNSLEINEYGSRFPILLNNIMNNASLSLEQTTKLEKEILSIIAEKGALVVKPKYSASLRSVGLLIKMLKKILNGCRKAIESEGELFCIFEPYDENQAQVMIEEIMNRLKIRGESIDMAMIPLDDKKTLQMITSGQTGGTYLLGDAALTKSIGKTMINSFEDLVQLIAIHSRGFVGEGMLDDFIKRKKGEIKVGYIHPLFKKILNGTYGIILYPDQIIEILHIIGGMPVKKAEEARRVIIRKEKEKIAVYKSAFVKGSVKKGLTERDAQRVFDLLAYFAEYAISKSFATKHATYAYQTAYLKAHYPLEFMAANSSYESA